jgi:hypothetical protein
MGLVLNHRAYIQSWLHTASPSTKTQFIAIFKACLLQKLCTKWYAALYQHQVRVGTTAGGYMHWSQRVIVWDCT